MPELPEVETVVRELRPVLTGKRITKTEIFDPKIIISPKSIPRGRMIRSVARIAKEIVIDVSSTGGWPKPLWLWIHLRMTGRLIWSTAPELAGRRQLRARFTLDDGYLLFYDTRRFGVLRVITDLTNQFSPGIDPLSDLFTPAAFADLLSDARQEIKPWLLRQDRLVGMGNIYASEALFGAKIHPARTGSSLTPAERKRLHAHIRRLLERAIKYCGTTIADFQDGRGQTGRFRRLLKVYGREGRSCLRCKTPIERFVQQGRSTFFCPNCQNG